MLWPVGREDEGISESSEFGVCEVRKSNFKAKFHYASWFGAGSKLVRNWFELKFGPSSSLLGANYSTS